MIGAVKYMKNSYYKYIKKNVPIRNVCEKLGVRVFDSEITPKCNCPFHNDTHPSMVLYQDDNVAYCFGCRNRWNNLSFVSEKLDIGFDETIKWFEKEFPDILSHRVIFSEQSKNTLLGNAYQIAYNIYSKMTEKEEEQLKKYALSRAFNANDLETKGVFFTSASKLKDSISLDENIEEVLKLKRSELIYQLPLQERDIKLHYQDYYSSEGVIITIRDVNGEIVGFAQRAIGEVKNKYRFTKKLPKGNLLYRLNEVKTKLSQTKKESFDLYLVEGMFDALRLEEKGKMAVAVLGNHLTENQAIELKNCLSSFNKTIFLHIFMDNDEAGRRGNYQTLQNLWKSHYFRNTYIDFRCPNDINCKDPDDYYKEGPDDQNIKYLPFDYLIRYSFGDELLYDSKKELKKRYEKASIEEKVHFLNNISQIMPRNAWKEVFNVYENWKIEQEDYFYQSFKNYIEGIRVDKETSDRQLEPDNLSGFQRALQIAKMSYDKEELPLDDVSWNRIATCADAFFKYFQELFEKKQHIETPLLTMRFPKRLGEEREKAIYIHERLIMQQYILDELLGTGYGGYENYIPAVRYRGSNGQCQVYTTGWGDQEEFDTVSFAYQIHMDAINGSEVAGEGMFRNYYDCWKAYIEFIHEGILCLESEKVYRIKLDIQKFYDNIPMFVVRNTLTGCVKEALKADNNKFSIFQIEEDDTAERVVEWILQEIYEPNYYDAETGKVCKKESDTVGIPQGPNLSAYLASVVLFDLDKRVSAYVENENQKAEEGTIRVRYARYVDDMVIIASDAEIIIHLKNLISSMLYDMGLSLSPKTDQADNISKEDAYDWIISEKGGLGVSAIYDFPDNTLDNILEEYEEYEVTDRRRALQLLQSVTRSFTMMKDDYFPVDKNVIDIFFQTEEVRFNDIIRISEILLYFAVTQPQNGTLWEEFCALWNNGKKCSPTDSLFQYENVEFFAFIEACNRILKKHPQEIRQVEGFKTWKEIQESIIKFWNCQEFLKQMEDTGGNQSIIQRNHWVMKFRLIELLRYVKVGENVYEVVCNNIKEENEYSRRWLYSLAGDSHVVYNKLLKKGWEFIKEEKVLYAFHFATVLLSCIKKPLEFSELKAVFISSKFRPYITNMADGILAFCMKCWFVEAEEKGNEDSKILRIALFVLLNCLTDTIKAEIIESIKALRNYIFLDHENSEMRCLPTVQGAEYPGLIAMFWNAHENTEIKNLRRIEFISGSKIIPNDRWILSTEHTEIKLYQLIQEHGYKSLEEYFRHENDDNLNVTMEKILKVFNKLCDCIKDIQEMNQDMRVILSKRNVFIKKEEDELEVKIAVYLVKRENSGSGVMLERGNGVFGFESLYENGNYFWQAGCLLKDACGFEKIRTEFLEEGKAQGDIETVQMLEYTFHRLTGTAVNRKSRYKGIHSYSKSVDRAIERTQIFLDKIEYRHILLEDNRIIDSFISARMGYENYIYLPAVCSYSTGIWAKNYLSKNFLYLMQLVSEKNVDWGETYPERRVPRLYLFLADNIKNIHNIQEVSNKEFLGLKVLEAGLRANAVLIHLRMQVLELIESLDDGRKKRLESRIGDLPWGILEMDGTEVISVGRKTVTDTLIRLLHGEHDKEISYFTHIGWLLILVWILEEEKCIEGGIVEEIKDVVQKILGDLSQENEEFPFEQMTNFFDLWSYDKIEIMLHLFSAIDKVAKITVEKRKTEDYYQEFFHKKTVRIGLDEVVKKPYYFLTYSKLDNALMPMELDLEEPNKKCYTQSIRAGKVVGVSAIENSLGQMLQRWEKNIKLDKPKGQNEIEGDLQKKEETHEKTLDENSQTGNKLQEPVIEKNAEVDLDKGLKQIRDKQEKSLQYRKKEFDNMDRIAFFQFKAACSYYHPSSELCVTLDKEGHYGYSCQEFRRRKILEEVFEICEQLKVEILLLPEYSVRPETVVWMYETIVKSGYTFSVWAGTFRIPYGYQFDDKWLLEDLNNKQHYHTAILPVISKREETWEIICEHIKKYPSIALNEDINPCLLLSNFKPVMEGISKYGEARSHVTELVCAEVFALSSPGNLVSFGKEAFKLQMKYMPGKLKVEDIKKAEEKFFEKMLTDVKTYGDAISLYRDDCSIERKSILLVPACTTRAVDYYVIGQANYLGSGGNMVFCNCADNKMNGGSCFIGQDSWDQWGFPDASKVTGTTSIYHGVRPGIYMQAMSRLGRGALGKKEQALVVCDVIPDLDKRKPNPESMRRALELVAHIPILEESIHATECLEKCICKKDSSLCLMELEREKKSKEETLEWIGKLNQAIESDSTIATSAEDKEPDKIAINLINLGNKYKSEWLAERGRQYEKGHRLYPRHWIPETAVDWRYIEINYEEFLDSSSKKLKDGCLLQVPNEYKKSDE